MATQTASVLQGVGQVDGYVTFRLYPMCNAQYILTTPYLKRYGVHLLDYKFPGNLIFLLIFFIIG